MTEYLPPFARDVVINVIANLVAAAILLGIGYLSFRRARSFVRALGFARRMVRHGFINFYNNREEYYSARSTKALDSYILSAKKNFAYVGFYLSAGTDTSRVDGAFRTLLERGCTIELVLLDPTMDDQLLAIIEKHIGIAGETLKARLLHAHAHFAAFSASLSADQRARFSVRQHRNVITSSAMFLDWGEPEGRLLVDTKIGGAGRDKSFGMEFRKTDSDNTLSSEWALSFRRIADGATTP